MKIKMYKIKDLVSGKYFISFEKGYYFGNGESFKTFDDAKLVQQFFGLYDSAIVEVTC